MGILNLWASQGFIIISLTVTVFILAAIRRKGWLQRLSMRAKRSWTP